MAKEEKECALYDCPRIDCPDWDDYCFICPYYCYRNLL